MFFSKNAVQNLMEETKEFVNSIEQIKSCLSLMSSDDEQKRQAALEQFTKVDQSLGFIASSLVSTDRVKSQFANHVIYLSGMPGSLDALLEFLMTKDAGKRNSDFLSSIRHRQSGGVLLTEKQAVLLASLYLESMN